MNRRNVDTKTYEFVEVSPEPERALGPRGMVARAVVFVGGASLLLGGVLGYALGFLEGEREKGDHHEV